MRKRAIVYDFVAVVITTAIVVGAVQYAYDVYTFDLTTLLVSVILPLFLGALLLALTRERILLHAFLAYIWAVVDDMPVYFDSVLTWPEVTRFHPFWPRLLVNIIIHALTLAFLYLAIQALKGRAIRGARLYVLAVLVLVAFGLAYAQNIPVNVIQNLVESSWYPFDSAEKLASLVVFSIALWVAESSDRKVYTSFP